MRQQSEPEGSQLMGCGTLLAQRPAGLPAKLQPWLINSQTGSLTRSCISQLCTPPAASVEPSCPGNFYNLPSIKSLLLWNTKILWNAGVVFLQTCTALNFSTHYTLFLPLGSKNFVFGSESFLNSVMAANRWCPWSWTKLHLLQSHTCTAEGFGWGSTQARTILLFPPLVSWRQAAQKAEKFSLKEQEKKQMALNIDIILQENESY